MSDELKEVLCRMWIDCDPNRGGSEPGSGFHPDDRDATGHPRWKWFEPRAEASLEYLSEHGFEIVAKLRP